MRVETADPRSMIFVWFSLQWSHAHVRVETAQWSLAITAASGFNGATRMCAWKLCVYIVTSPRIKGFNGATRTCAWKRLFGVLVKKRYKSLQWSHAHVRVETTCSSAR